MNSEETEITLKIKVNFGWNAGERDEKNARADAIGLAINPDFSSVRHGVYLNGVTLEDINGNIITKF